MTEDEKGATSDVERLVGKELTQLRAELTVAREEIDRKSQEISDLKLANAKLRERAETEVKGKLIDDIRRVSNYGIEFLSGCSVDRLEQILEDSKMLKKPLFSSSGDFGKKSDPHEKLYTMFKYGKRRE